MTDLIDVTKFGARSTNAWWQVRTGATGVAGSKQLTLTSPVSGAVQVFQNGDGITIWGAGAPSGLSQPSTPSIQNGISQTETVPDASLSSLPVGATSYSYCIVARNKSGGLSAASPVAVVQGSSSLGQQTIPVSTWSVAAGQPMVITTTKPHGLLVNSLIHATNSTNAGVFSGWWVVTSVPTPTTIEIAGTSRNLNATATGGQVVYFIGNRVTWSSVTGAFQYAVYGQRPGEPSLHLLGVSIPGYNSFVDWGSQLIENAQLPGYLSNGYQLTAPSNNYLSSIVESGGGTTTLTLRDSLVSPVAGTTALHDDAPAFLAAANAAGPGQSVYIPPTGGGQNYFQINSFLEWPTARNIVQAGQIRVGETIEFQGDWTGVGGGYGTPQFAYNSAPPVNIAEANPGIHFLGGNIKHLTLNGYADQSVLLHADGLWGTTFEYVNFSTGTLNSVPDNSGIAAMLRGVNIVFRYCNFLCGPGYTIDQTWTPAIYLPVTWDGSGSSGNWSMEHCMFNRRGILFRAYGGGGMDVSMSDCYIQGSITPFLAVQNNNGLVNAHVFLKRLYMDTSSQAFLALWNGVSAQVLLEGTNNGGMGVEVGGRPSLLTGVPVNDLHASLVGSVLGQ